MRSRVLTAAIVFLVGAGTAAGHPQSPTPPAAQGGAASVAVPQGNGVPVITDGIFTHGEWDDAQRVAVADGVTLFIKEHRGVVFIGVRGQGINGIGPSELSLAVPDGPILKLHVSYALYEVALPQAGPEPKPRMGFTADWYANELRRDEAEVARLQKEGGARSTSCRRHRIRPTASSSPSGGPSCPARPGGCGSGPRRSSAASPGWSRTRRRLRRGPPTPGSRCASSRSRGSGSVAPRPGAAAAVRFGRPRGSRLFPRFFLAQHFAWRNVTFRDIQHVMRNDSASSPTPELKKGSLELLVLSVLAHRPRHGYEIGRLIELGSGGHLSFRITTLFGTEPADPLVFAVTLAGLSVAGVVAAVAPARGAARVDPIVTLRCE